METGEEAIITLCTRDDGDWNQSAHNGVDEKSSDAGHIWR